MQLQDYALPGLQDVSGLWYEHNQSLFDVTAPTHYTCTVCAYYWVMGKKYHGVSLQKNKNYKT